MAMDIQTLGERLAAINDWTYISLKYDDQEASEKAYRLRVELQQSLDHAESGLTIGLDVALRRYTIRSKEEASAPQL